MSFDKTTQSEETLWHDYLLSKSPATRESIILKYAPLVKYVAGRVAIGLPSNVEFDDLVSFGVFGLMDAIEKYDPSRGIKFETYAISRIRGSILDGLRSNDWVPRSVRQKARELERICSDLENKLGRSASDQEISEAMNISIQEFYELLSEVSSTTLSSLDELWMVHSNDEDSVRVLDLVRNNESEDPLHQVEMEEIKSTLASAIDYLPERERMVIALYYYEGLTLKEIGEIMEISESRVSQIHTKAIFRLRGRLNRWRKSYTEI
ncbi:RNA polymerase sigma factor for flagellar operon FliA [Hydrogenispora ethanolica]|jgi:RNA polymerase sigma factor for flagellar operon FliA|uniref:RNA polymerase sigma factor n=1 Tax=Hydrogenispora ethanolica TaxID=1082276 RepID=A0A4R1RKM2_HYDET|nr:RNA polymerase sigma factor WhiG [Hydrogenispora ethanolica]TCL66569.1 RNA polymerase sigma factor for flagellar operon FliA [Hydrogenispora ethanolica]